MTHDGAKKRAAEAAVDECLKDGQKVGLGTGSTAVWAVRRIGQLLEDGAVRDIRAVATSSQSLLEAQQLGIPLRSINDPEIGGTLDVAFDGADEVDGDGNITKGGGGALLMEKIIAYASSTVVIVVDSSKLVDRLGISFPVPVEVLQEARIPVTNAIERLGGRAVPREAVRKMGLVITDNGNALLDVTFPSPIDPVAMECELSAIPGVIENGLFTHVRPVVFVGGESEVKRLTW
jgi:ribose 5-phosphate isomerase A